MPGKNKDWGIIFDEYRVSGLSKRKFCEEQNIPFTQFRYRWYRESGLKTQRVKSSSTTAPLFESISIAMPLTESKPRVKDLSFIVYLPNQIRCEVKGFSEEKSLGVLLKALVNPC